MKETELRSTRERPGWLFPYLLALDEMFIGRWEYWLSAVEKDDVPMSPIPYIHFQAGHSYPAREVYKNINKCIDYASHNTSSVMDKFADWLLWGFGYKRNLIFPSIEGKIDDFWYRTFNLGLFYQEPGDHFADIAMEHHIGDGAGFTPTPANVVEMMVRMTMGGEPKHYHKAKSVMDPCCGTGIMLLHASNYSLNLYGNDINPLLCKLAIINGYIYMPWLVYRPKHLSMFNKSEAKSIIEVELPSGIKIPECQECGNNHDFIKSIETDCNVRCTGSGIEVDQKNTTLDIIGKKLALEDIRCAPCSHKIKEEIS